MSLLSTETMELPKWSTLELLSPKRDRKVLTDEQIEAIVQAVSDGSMEDCQLGAFLMSVYLNGLTTKEVVALSKSMKNSGSNFQWPEPWKVVDKHSTGGVGDKISLALAPALAVYGLKVPMISGRGLGHTGGTLDKLESIPGFKVSLTEPEMMECLEKVGCCIVGQTKTLVPADGRMYSVRDVTATVQSMPLIVSSIISKKAAEGLQSLVMDVKFGSGSIVGSLADAEVMADALVEVGAALGIKTTALVTSMEAPIGRCVGNSLEVQEALECLRGKGPSDLKFLASSLGGELMFNTAMVDSIEAGKKLIEESLNNGSALGKFCEMIQSQGVSQEVAEALCGPHPDQSILPKASLVSDIVTETSGRITRIDALTIAEICLYLGGGRKKTSDIINYAVGVVLKKVVGDVIVDREPWLQIHHDEPLKDTLIRKVKGAITIRPIEELWSPQELVVKRVSKCVSS